MAVRTARQDRPLEVDAAVLIPRTVDPAETTPVRDRQLVQLVAMPVEIRLPFSPGARDDVETLGATRRIGRASAHRRLVEARGGGVHPETQVAIRGLKDVLADGEAAVDCAARRWSRRQTMRRLLEGGLLPVAGETRGVTGGIRGPHRLGAIRLGKHECGGETEPNEQRDGSDRSDTT